MLTYVESVNRAIREELETASRPVVCFGQNVSAGSCLSGLTRGLPERAGMVEVIDTPNCENALVAFGFGMMLEGAHAVFFVKQLDFLLLALDQLVNTYNMVRLQGATGSFTIVPIVVDSGYEGPQSRFNNLADLCSMADLPGFALSETGAARHLIERHLLAPGARVLALSQRLFRSKSLEESADPVAADASTFQLAEGPDATIVAFNFAWPQARELHAALLEDGITASLFGVSACDPSDWEVLCDSVARTRRLILLDDSRVRNRPGDRLRAQVADRGIPHAALSLYRPIDVRDLPPQPDRFVVDPCAVRAWIEHPSPLRGSRHG